jgi:hypothetical protein
MRRMENTGQSPEFSGLAKHPPRSIAFEMAVLFLNQLEPRVAENPELLVSTEAILSLAIIRQSDREMWAHWRAFLARYQKAELIEHLLREPAQISIENQSKAARLITLTLNEGVEFFHDFTQRGWVSLRSDSHWENHQIRSRAFILFLSRLYYRETGEAPGTQAVRAALEQFEAVALFDGERCQIHLRVAEHDGQLYLDLCDDHWRAVQIDPRGWRMVDQPPVKFYRSRGSQPLSEPKPGGSLEELRPFLNVDEHAWTLIRGFLVATLRPDVPCPVLVVKGDQGAGKSTACRAISRLIDPRTSALRGAPHNVRDLVAAARNSWLVCFDNLSHLPEELADAACRLATGGGFGGRELYSDHEEAVFDATRPLVFNAIPDLGAARPDLLDRALIVELQGIRADVRRDERCLWREFDEARPRILGGLLDALAAGLRRLPGMKLDQLPRMADFAAWVTACEQGLGLVPGAFLEVYKRSRTDAQSLALEVSPLYEPIRALAGTGFSGTIAELLTQLNKLISDDTRRSRRWPKAPNALSNALRRMATNLREAGIELEFRRPDHSGRRIVFIRMAASTSKSSSASSATHHTRNG